MMIRGEPFFPWDITIAKEAAGIVGNIHFNISMSIFLFTLALILIQTFSLSIPVLVLKKEERIAYFSLVVFLIALSCPGYFLSPTNQKRIGVNNIAYAQGENYQKNGIINAFLTQIKLAIIEKPIGYNRNSVINSLSTGHQKTTTNSDLPNIIMVMSESFSDPTKLPGVTYSIDPLAGYHKLQNESTSADLLIEQFGGNTANTEFGVLTGSNAQFLPLSSSPYEQYIKKPLSSLVSILESSGYKTIAIHPYHKWFWNRDNVYKKLGFDNFLDIDTFDKQKTKGAFISDDAAVDKVIQSYNERDKNFPFFSFLVTIQNHPSYSYGGVSESGVEITAPALDEKNLGILRTYASGVIDADNSLERLVNYFRGAEKHTVIVFFSDHLPTFGDNYNIYRQTNFISSNNSLSKNDQKKLHEVPVLIWDNKTSTKNDLGLISDYFLSPYLLNKYNIPMNDEFHFLSLTRNKIDGCNRFACVDDKGNDINLDSQEFSEIFNDMAAAQYYHLFDK